MHIETAPPFVHTGAAVHMRPYGKVYLGHIPIRPRKKPEGVQLEPSGFLSYRKERPIR